MFIVGVDPGKKGGLVCLRTQAGELPAVHELQSMPETALDLYAIVSGFARDAQAHGMGLTFYIEKVHSSPQMGVASAFTFGRGYGQLELAAAPYRTVYVTAQTWQKQLQCTTGGDKKISLAKAKALFPSVFVREDGRPILVKLAEAYADALLIAEYGRRAEWGLLQSQAPTEPQTARPRKTRFHL